MLYSLQPRDKMLVDSQEIVKHVRQWNVDLLVQVSRLLNELANEFLWNFCYI